MKLIRYLSTDYGTCLIFSAICILIALLVGCGLQLKDDAATNIGIYAAGRTAYPIVDAIADEVMTIDQKNLMIAELENRYKALLDATAGQTDVTPEQSVALYNDLVLIAGGYIDDPYMIFSDLAFITQQFGAQFITDDEGNLTEMVSINTVPRNAYVSFDLGWHVSKRMIQRENQGT